MTLSFAELSLLVFVSGLTVVGIDRIVSWIEDKFWGDQEADPNDQRDHADHGVEGDWPVGREPERDGWTPEVPAGVDRG